MSIVPNPLTGIPPVQQRSGEIPHLPRKDTGQPRAARMGDAGASLSLRGVSQTPDSEKGVRAIDVVREKRGGIRGTYPKLSDGLHRQMHQQQEKGRGP